MYYERLFPFEFFWDWFSYGEGAAESPSTTTDWGKREWSFTLCPTPTDEIYIRYQVSERAKHCARESLDEDSSDYINC